MRNKPKFYNGELVMLPNGEKRTIHCYHYKKDSNSYTYSINETVDKERIRSIHERSLKKISLRQRGTD